MKYELTDEKADISFNSNNPNYAAPCRGVLRLRRIRALVDIPRHGVKAGDLGGWIQREENLSQEGDAWVGGSAAVALKAVVKDNAVVYGSARVTSSEISDNAEITGFGYVVSSFVTGSAVARGSAVVANSTLYGNAVVEDLSIVQCDSVVGDSVHLLDHAFVDNSKLSGNSTVGGTKGYCGHPKTLVERSTVEGKSDISGFVKVEGSRITDSSVSEEATVSDSSVEGNSFVLGNAVVCNGSSLTDALVRGNACVNHGRVKGELDEHAYVTDETSITSGVSLSSPLNNVSVRIFLPYSDYADSAYLYTKNGKSVSLSRKDDVVKKLQKDWRLAKDFHSKQEIDAIVRFVEASVTFEPED